MKTIEELEALLEAVTRERDELRTWQAQIAEPLGYLVRAFGVGGYDVAEPSVIVEAWRALERERDEAHAEASSAMMEWKARRCECGADDFCKIVQERDEARAYAEDRNDEANKLQRCLNMAATERDEARAEVERITDERDELLVRVANQEAELRATREAYNGARTELTRERIGIRPVDEVRSDAYRRGAEAMRDECIGAACGFFMGTTGFCNGDEDELEAVLEALPIPEEP